MTGGRHALAVLLVVASAASARADDDDKKSPWGENPPRPLLAPPEKQKPSAGEAAPEPAPDAQQEGGLKKKLHRYASWITIEEESASPPLLTLQVGFIHFITSHTTLQYGRGTNIDDAERDISLPEGRSGMFAEGTIGDVVRVGAGILDWRRSSRRYRYVERAIDADGAPLVQPGDVVRAGLSYTQVEGFVEWDVLYGSAFRIGLTGGARYTRVTSRIEAVRLRSLFQLSASADETVLSPILGGLIELTPVPLVTFYTRIGFIDWSWRGIGLRDQRTYEIRAGASVNFIPDTLGIAFDVHFLSAAAQPNSLEKNRSKLRYELDAAGIAISILGRF